MRAPAVGEHLAAVVPDGESLLQYWDGLLYRCRPDGTLVVGDESCRRLTGYAPAELVLSAIVHPDDRPMVQQNWFGAAQPYRLTYRILTATGEVKWVWDQGRLLPNGEREGALTDVTAQKQIEESLRQWTNHLQLQQVVAAAAHESASVAAAMQAALDLVCAFTHWPVGHVYFASREPPIELLPSNLWHVSDAARYRVLQEATRTIRLAPGVELPGQVLISRKPTAILELADQTDFPRASFLLEAGLTGTAAVPVCVGDDVAAVLEFFWHDAPDPDGRLMQVLGFVAVQLGRVIERERAVEQLAARESQFRALIENASDLITILDREGVIRYESPSVERVLGYRPDELVGRNAFDLVHPEERAALLAEFAQKVVIAGSTAQVEFRFQHRDGSWRTLEAVAKNLLDEPEFNGIIVNSRDVTERRAAAAALEKTLQALRASEERYRSLFTTMREGFALHEIICDEQGRPVDSRFLEVNAAFEELTGLRAADVLGRRLLEVLPDLEREWIETYGAVALTGQAVRFERYAAPLKKYYEVFAYSPKRGQFANIFTDITERKQAEETLRGANRRLEQALTALKNTQQQIVQQERLRALGTMASGIAHDFNNALASILGFSELLLNRPETLEDRAKTRRFLQLIHTAAKDAGNVVGRLREFYRHRDAGEVFTHVNLNELVQQAVSLTQPKWRSEALAQGITIDVVTRLDPNLPPLTGNSAELREVLTNLIFNAVDALPRGGTIAITTQREADRAVLTVHDTGTGMTEEVRRRCFEPFFSTKGERGTGLGLAMVYGILNRHDGVVDLESAPGQGTTFTIYLPIGKTTSAAPVATASPEARRSLRILLVEDEEMVRTVLWEFLTGDGHVVTAAADGRQGLEKFHGGQFDVVLVDRAMPGLNGDQVATAIKSVAPRLPVVLITGFGAMMQAAGEKPAGVDYILAKPVTLERLRETLREATRSSPD